MWCAKHDIKRFLFDLDDTICSTRHLFSEALSEAADLLSLHAPHQTRADWLTYIEEINNRLFEQIGVNPIRWNFVVNEMAAKNRFQKGLEGEMKQIFKKIYTTPLKMQDGAEEGLQIVKNTGIPIGIVTHANRDWTNQKYAWLNLERFVRPDQVYIVSEDGHKTSESWLQAMHYFKVKPAQCAVVGDSPRSDIIPAQTVGVKHCFLVENSAIWSIHNLPVSQEVVRIKTLKQIAEVVSF